MEAAIAALRDAAREGIVARLSLASTTSAGKPAPSTPTTNTTLPAGNERGTSQKPGTAATVVKPVLRASRKKSTESNSLATGAWKMEPIVARTVLGL